jgi:hypothetical protein
MHYKSSELAGEWQRARNNVADRCNGRTYTILKAIGLLAVATLMFWTFAPMTRLAKIMPGRQHNCHVGSSRSLDFDFRDLESFDFVEQFEKDAKSSSGRFKGLIQILPAVDDQASDIRVNVAISASSSVISEAVQYEASKSSLTINLPRPWDQHSGTRPWLEVNASLHIRSGLTLNDLSIASDTSHVDIPKAIDLRVNNTTNINLRSGGVTANPFFASRDTEIDVGSGSISGEYPLYDLLSLRTRAGSIIADVVPKPVDKDAPAPAVFAATSYAGSVRVTYPPHGAEIPRREYRTTVSSRQGSVNGRFLHGVDTVLETNAGSITADILPFAANDYKSTLHTRTNAGSQTIKLLSPYADPGARIGGLSSFHQSHASGITIEYPPEWEGKIDGRTSFGSLTLRGNVRIIKEGGTGSVGRYVLAEKGDGDSDLKFRTSAGSATVEMK